MTFLYLIIGLVAAMAMASLGREWFVALVGGGMGILFARIFVLVRRISDLEQKLGIIDRGAAPPDIATAPARQRQSPLPELRIEEEKVDVAAMEQSPGKDIPAAMPESGIVAASPVVPESAPQGGGQAIEWFDIIRSYFTGGNVVVRVGVMVLFFGVAFLLKYSIERDMIPVEIRLAAICIGGMAMLVIGWRLRSKMTTYSLILQGGGVGVLYLTIFSALKLYALLPVPVSLGLLAGLAGFSAVLAILQDARALAVIGIVGGFLAPVLTSTGGGSHVMLFSYYALLNFGILFTARHKSWRELNFIGFVFTFAISALWGLRSFVPEMFVSTAAFLVLFFLFYLAIGLLFASNQPLARKGYVDCTMVFGTPVVCFALQYYLVRGFEFGMAWSALGMGAVYVGIAWAVKKKGSAAMGTLIESFLFIGVVFATIAIPLAVDGRWTSAAWALEGAAVVWVGIRQKRPVARVFGMVMQGLAGLCFVLSTRLSFGGYPVVNGFYLGCLVVSMAAFISAFFLYRADHETAKSESGMMLAWALLWGFGGGWHEIDCFVPHFYKPSALLLFVSASVLDFRFIADGLSWRVPGRVYRGLFFLMFACGLYTSFVFYCPPSAFLGFAAWPFAFGVHYYLLYRDRREPRGDFSSFIHTVLLIFMIALLSFEAYWRVERLLPGGAGWVMTTMPTGFIVPRQYLFRFASIWPLSTLAVVPGLFVFFLSRFSHTLPWPVAENRRSYVYHAMAPVVVFLWAGSVLTNLFCHGDPAPLRYVPFLNPLDLAQVMVLVVCLFWARTLAVRMDIQPFSLLRRQLVIITGGTVFLWLNATLIRTLHFWFEVGFDLHSMMDSGLVQASLSIFWALSAFAVMSWASRKKIRVVWLVGAALVGVVVVKLFLFDLGNTGTIARIISFLGVGVICLIIGYLSPLPGREAEGTEAAG